MFVGIHVYNLHYSGYWAQIKTNKNFYHCLESKIEAHQATMLVCLHQCNSFSLKAYLTTYNFITLVANCSVNGI